MTFTTDVPISGDSLGGTRDRIRTNNQVIASTLAVNHVAFGGIEGEGKHKFLQMPEQSGSIGQVGAPLPPTTAANEAGFYAKVGTNPAETNLVFRAESNGFEYQMTRAISASTARFGTYVAYGSPPAGFTQSGGWTFLPGGLILQYGFYGKTVATQKTGSIIFPIQYTNAAYSVTAIIYRTGLDVGNMEINTLPTTTGFDFRARESDNDGIFWQAIGK